MIATEADAEEFLETLINAANLGADVIIIGDGERLVQLVPILDQQFSLERALA